MEVNIEKIMDDIRAEIKEKGYKVGMWHPTTGYWMGIDPDGDLYKEDANIHETLTTEELIDNIQTIVDNTAEDLGDKEQNKIFEENSQRTLKNFNEKREIIHEKHLVLIGLNTILVYNKK